MTKSENALPRGPTERIRAFVENRATQRSITILIVLNALVLALETSPAAMAAAGSLLKLADRVILWIFVVEILLKLIGQRRDFVRDPWNHFDTVVVTNLFGDRFPDWFGNIGSSAYTLFQIMTLESWSMGIVRPVMEVFPHAWFFFVPFILVTSFAVLNLFIGIIVDAMQTHGHGEIGMATSFTSDPEPTLADLQAEIRALRTELAELKRS